MPGEYVDISTIGIEHVSPTPSPLPSSPDKATVSYWMATLPEDRLPSSLSAPPAQSDVVIIGSGITGVSTAYHLIKTSSSISTVTIVEARSFCSGATGRNGGHLTAASALAYSDLAANPSHLLGKHAYGADEVKSESAKVVQEVLQFEADTAAAIRALIEDEHAEEKVGFTDQKNWHLCFEQAEVQAFEESLRQAGEHLGLRKLVDQVRRVPKEEVERRMNRPVGVVGVYEIPGATLHPRALVSLIYERAQRAARAKGVSLNLVTNLPVLKVATSSTGSILSTANGDISAQYVVHATNGYASHLIPQLSSSSTGIIPTRAQVVAVAPTVSTSHWGMGLSAGGGYEYGHQRPRSWEEPVYILGGGREHATGREWGVADDTTLNKEVSAFLHPYMAKVFPQSYGNEVTREWTGIMGYTRSKDPLVGPLDEKARGKQYIAAGYSGHGMTRAWGCASVVADMIVAEAEGKRWKGREGFPRCYLTETAKTILEGGGPEEEEKTLVEAEPREVADEKGQQGERDNVDEKSGRQAAFACCVVT